MSEITAVITQETGKISCNFEQVEKAIKDTLAEYKGAVFTEDSKTYAKKHVASLRKQKKDFQDNLRSEKKRYMEPWEKFETQAKELISLYDEPIDLINGQVQAFEEKRVAEKKKLIHKIYKELVPASVGDYIPLERIYNPKWENATFKEKDIRSDITGMAERVQKDIATVTGMGSEAEEKALGVYRANLDITEAIACINEYERQKQEILAREQERARREEEERIRREEQEKLLAEQRAREEKEAALRQAELEKQEALRKAELERQEALRKAEQEKQEALRRAELERQEAMRRAEAEKAAEVEQARETAAREVIENFIPDAEGDTELYEYRMSLSSDAKEKLEMYMDSVGIEWEMIV